MRPAARAACVALLAFAAYAGTVRNGFALDDVYAVHDNPVVSGIVPLREAFVRDSWGGGKVGTRTYRPLQTVLLAIEQRVFGGRAGPMHAVNALLHACVAAAAYLVLRRLASERVALGAAALFAVLACTSEAVEALVGVADVLVALFALLGLRAHRLAGARGAALATAALAFAFASKETALFAPLAWLAADAILPAGPLRQRVGRLVAYAAVAAAWLAVRYAAFGTWTPPATGAFYNALSQAGAAGRMLGAGRIFAERYLAGLIVPTRRLYLCTAPDCGPSPPSDAVAWLGLLLAAAIAAGCLALRRRAPAASFGLAWFLIFFLPVSNMIVPSSTPYAERLLYVPCIGLALAASAAFDALAERVRPALAYGVLGALAAANLLAVQVRHFDWRSSEDLYLSGLELAPQSAGVQCFAAQAYFSRADLPSAEAHAERALALWPPLPDCLSLMALIRERQHRYDEADALIGKSVQVARDPLIFSQAAAYLTRTGRSAQAIELLERALRRYPDRPLLRSQLEALKRRTPGK